MLQGNGARSLGFIQAHQGRRSTIINGRCTKSKGVSIQFQRTYGACRAWLPSGIPVIPKEKERQRRKRACILRDILHSLFSPYAEFRRAYDARMLLESHKKYKGLIRKSFKALHRKATKFGDIREQGLVLGLFRDHDDSKIVDDWNDLKNTLDPILKSLPPKTSA